MNEITSKYEYVYTNAKKLYARIFDEKEQVSKLFTYDIDQYTPELFVPTSEKTEYISHYDNSMYLKKVQFSNIKSMQDYIKQNSAYLPIHGNKYVPMKFIRDNFNDTLASNHEFRTHFIDIETRVTLDEFPDPSTAKEEISLIQIYDTFEKKYFILGTRDYDNSIKFQYGEVKYIKCKDELDLLSKYIALVQKLDPIIMIGFNSFKFDFPYIINRLNNLGLNANKLSPIGVINSKEVHESTGFTYFHYDIVGRILLDYREFYLKYAYTALPKFNLETIANHELGEGKIEHDEYMSFEEFYQNDYQKFVEYGIKDVEILVSLDKKLQFINTAKYISYICGVNLPDVAGTYKQWYSLVYNKAIQQNEVLPIDQKFSNPDDTFIGGWVLSKPGKYDWVVSFDFASLYPSVIRLLNLGIDTLVKDSEMPDELKELRAKYFYWYNNKTSEEICKAKNNNQDEIEHIMFLMENKEYIHSVLTKYNVCASPNGFFYRKDKESVFANLMKKIYIERVADKATSGEYAKKAENEQDEIKAKEYLDLSATFNLSQLAKKVLINSAYGSLSLEVNSFSHGKGYSCAVTSGGRLSNRWCNYKINEGINKISGQYKNVINLPYTTQADTDSGYINVSYLMNKKGLYNDIEKDIDLAGNIGKKVIQKFIDEGIKDICYLLNAYDETVLDMEQELVTDKFVSTGDKRYYARYWKKDKKTGKMESKFKITGLNIISKSTPPWCKEKLKPVLEMILDKGTDEILKYIDKCRIEFKQASIKDISIIKGVSSLDYSWQGEKLKSNSQKNCKTLGAPIGSRAAILHNEIIKKKKMNYPMIHPGDKVYMSNLIVPNVAKNQEIIGFVNPKFIEDSNLINYIDYETMFKKNFLSNIEHITTPIGMSLDKYHNTVDEWL